MKSVMKKGNEKKFIFKFNYSSGKCSVILKKIITGNSVTYLGFIKSTLYAVMQLVKSSSSLRVVDLKMENENIRG